MDVNMQMDFQIDTNIYMDINNPFRVFLMGTVAETEIWRSATRLIIHERRCILVAGISAPTCVIYCLNGYA